VAKPLIRRSAAPSPHARGEGHSTSIIAGLIALTFAVFGRVAAHSFLNFDDDQIVARNFEALKWTPLTWLSHSIDLGLWGERAGMHALTNVALHAANAALLFVALRRMTRAVWPSAFVAAVFAVHPMHVESVAWISERKDTLSTLFALLAILSYPKSKLRVFLMMALSLLAKPMYVTLPFVLLLLDYWPLQRLDDVRARIVEKIPLFALSAAGVALAVLGQTHLRAVQSSSSVENALVAYVRYLGKFFVPVNLAIPYPMTPVSTLAATAAATLLIIITACSLLAARRSPAFPVGWLWFLGTLVPVIGLVQIGVQSMADRYTYFPYIGLAIMIAFAARRWPYVEAAFVAILAVLAFHQAGYWKNSETLFAHTIAVTPPNAVAEYNLGQALEFSDQTRAIRHLTRAIELQPDFTVEWYPQAWVGLGTAHLVQAQRMPPGETRTRLISYSMECNRRALELDPKTPHAANNLKVAAQMLGR